MNEQMNKYGNGGKSVCTCRGGVREGVGKGVMDASGIQTRTKASLEHRTTNE